MCSLYVLPIYCNFGDKIQTEARTGGRMATDEEFFEEQSDASAVKARIIGNFFSSWANIILPTARAKGQKIAYIDLYCGPGRYGDNQKSTPLLVLEKAVAKPELAANLVTFFN